MATRVLGPKGSKKRRRFLFVPILLIAGLALFWIGSASPSVHDIAVFQLDGNATVADTGPLGYPGDDWQNICTTAAPNVKTGTGACTPGTGDTAHRVGSAFDYDQHLAGPAGSGVASCPKTNPTVYAPGNNCTTFTGGGSKDDGDINGWAWNDGSGGLPDKDNLEQGYSARYTYTTTLTQAVVASNPCDPTAPATIHIDNTVASWFSTNQQNFQANNNKDYHLTIGNETMLVTGGQNTNTLNVLRCQQGSTDGAHAVGDQVTVSLLYFGGTRFDNSGDAQIGIWFFQNNVALGTGKVGGGTSFSGVHKDGDILILSTFTGGGETPTIQVWKWVAGQGNNGNTNLQLLSPQAGASCIPVAGTTITEVSTTSPFCAAVNPADGVASPWTFTNKRGRSTFDAAEFYEGGLNISAFPQLASECFGSFEIETRSSQSTSAVLKDFLLGPLQSCKPSVTTDDNKTDPVLPGDTVTDTATVTGGRGGGALGPAPTGTVKFFLCATTACTVNSTNDGVTNGSQLGAAKTLNGSSNPSSVTSDAVPTPMTPGDYCFLAIYIPGTDPNYGSTPATSADNVTSSGETNEATRECFTVVQLPTSTVTSPQSPGGTNVSTVTFGTSVVDYAKVTGSTAGGNPTGTVSFWICNPGQVSGAAGSEVCAAGDGSPVTPDESLSAISGSDPPASDTTSAAVTANQLGVWCFRATYNPASNSIYLTSSDNTHDECFSVTATSSASSAQNWLPNDHVDFTTQGGASLAGRLTITLRQSTCLGTVKFTEPAPYDGSADVTLPISGGIDTHNTTFKVNTSNQDTYYWRIVFVPNSSFATGFIKCETSTVAINDSP